jgi:hypothetical protein
MRHFSNIQSLAWHDNAEWMVGVMYLYRNLQQIWQKRMSILLHKAGKAN